MTNILNSTIQLRDQAWATLQASPLFAQVRALDDAVVAMGGASLFVKAGTNKANLGQGLAGLLDAFSAAYNTPALTGNFSQRPKRISHSDAAFLALSKAGRPMQSSELLEAARAEGANIGGDKPIANLTSSLSRHDDIINVRLNGTPYWWLKDQPIPAGYMASGDQSSPTAGNNFVERKPEPFVEKGGGSNGTDIDDIIG